jgi:hypothetical protein
MLVALQFQLAIPGVYQAFSSIRPGVEIASQAEYAGWIPVIGSTVIGSTKILFSAIIARTNAFQESVLTGV